MTKEEKVRIASYLIGQAKDLLIDVYYNDKYTFNKTERHKVYCAHKYAKTALSEIDHTLFLRETRKREDMEK